VPLFLGLVFDGPRQGCAAVEIRDRRGDRRSEEGFPSRWAACLPRDGAVRCGGAAPTRGAKMRGPATSSVQSAVPPSGTPAPGTASGFRSGSPSPSSSTTVQTDRPDRAEAQLFSFLAFSGPRGLDLLPIGTITVLRPAARSSVRIGARRTTTFAEDFPTGQTPRRWRRYPISLDMLLRFCLLCLLQLKVQARASNGGERRGPRRRSVRGRKRSPLTHRAYS